MGYLIINKDEDGMRQEMRRNMRGGSYRYDGHTSMRDDKYGHGYRMGYRHGWEDHEDEMDDMDYRRARDSRGRYV